MVIRVFRVGVTCERRRKRERKKEGRKERKEGGRKERKREKMERRKKPKGKARVRERERTVDEHPGVCLVDCEPRNETELCLSDVTDQCRHDELDRVPRWAGQLVRCMAAGIVRSQEQLSTILRHGVDVVRSVRGFSLLGLAEKRWGCLPFIQHKLGWKDDRR